MRFLSLFILRVLMCAVPPPSTVDLAVAICTQNNIRTIERTLQSIRPIARRIVVIDAGSHDGTIETCRAFNAEIIHNDWPGHVKQKQFAIDRCVDHRWVLVIDSDESVEPPLLESIRQTIDHDDPEFDGWELNRKVWFLGDFLHHTFQPEWRLRLVRGGKARVAGVSPHDRLEVHGRVGRLTGDLRHDSWADVTDMIQRYLSYARICAVNGYRGGSIANILLNPPSSMLKQLILKRGFLDGHRGLIAATGVGVGTMLKHLAIAETRLRHRANERETTDEHR
jgi:glycosyltransferase involved in cell wall biosynthesis